MQLLATVDEMAPTCTTKPSLNNEITGRKGRKRPSLPAGLLRGSRRPLLWIIALLSLAAFVAPARAQDKIPCNESGPLSPLSCAVLKEASGRQQAGSQQDLLVTGVCVVGPGTYYFKNVNIVETYTKDPVTKVVTAHKGVLVFREPKPGDHDYQVGTTPKTEFWANSILIESGGAMLAGAGTYKDPDNGHEVSPAQFGSYGGTLSIVLYGEDQSPPTKFVPPNTWPKPGPHGMAAPCKSPAQDGAGNVLAPCGIPDAIWSTNGTKEDLVLPGHVTDRFYKYGGLYLDDAPDPAKPAGYFGYKSIGLAYGGTLQLRGLKGTSLSDDSKPDSSGSSWVRLAADVKPGDTKLTVDRDVKDDWQAKDELHEGDEIVLTTTDYMPTHSEELRIVGFDGKRVIRVEQADAPGEGVRFAHVGHVYDVAGGLKAAPAAFKKAMSVSDPDGDNGLVKSGETQAAVALLRRSIRIMSGGDRAGETFAEATAGDATGVPANSEYQFGGQVIFRQGFEKLQVQGVEFHQLGVGGRLGHYPVHFHMARQVPAETYIKDSSVSESMTRWFVIHATQGVTLQRNVGWKSIGHGYFLENGVETGNRFYSNIGIFARPAIVNAAINPR